MWEAVIIAFFGGAIALFWPWLQTFQRGWKFRRLIRRELEEIGPHPPDPRTDKPWWEHASRRFIHEEIFQRSNISENRDFLLSLNPGVVYQVSQLWIALEKRDGTQWMHFLNALAKNRKVRSRKLRCARRQWQAIVAAQPPGWLETMGIPTAYRQEAALGRAPSLFEERFEVYRQLLRLTEYGPEERPKELDSPARNDLADRMTKWFYEDGGGLLLSGRALVQFNRARELLRSPMPAPPAVWAAMSGLRTDLKIDLGVRQPQERLAAMAWPEEERW